MPDVKSELREPTYEEGFSRYAPKYEIGVQGVCMDGRLLKLIDDIERKAASRKGLPVPYRKPNLKWLAEVMHSIWIRGSYLNARKMWWKVEFIVRAGVKASTRSAR